MLIFLLILIQKNLKIPFKYLLLNYIKQFLKIGLINSLKFINDTLLILSKPKFLTFLNIKLLPDMLKSIKNFYHNLLIQNLLHHSKSVLYLLENLLFFMFILVKILMNINVKFFLWILNIIFKTYLPTILINLILLSLLLQSTNLIKLLNLFNQHELILLWTFQFFTKIMNVQPLLKLQLLLNSFMNTQNLQKNNS